MPHRTSSPIPSVKERLPQVGADEDQPLFSPCCKKCKLLPDNTCGGCGRTIMEITMWKSLPKAQREIVLKRLQNDGF